MYEFSGIFAWIKNLIYSNSIFDAVGMSSEDKVNAYIDYLFDAITNIFFSFLDHTASMFNSFGNKAISLFQIDFTNNFFVTVCGCIFGFFIFKFVLGKVIDLVSRIIDFT